MTSRCIGVGVDEPAHIGIVITGLEIVERGLSVLGLTAMPDYALDTHTKSCGFRVGILCWHCFAVCPHAGAIITDWACKRTLSQILVSGALNGA